MFDKKEYMKQYYQKNRKRILQKTKKYIFEHKVKYKIYMNNYMKEYNKKYYEENCEKEKERKRLYYFNNPEKIKKRDKKYRISNIEKIRKFKNKYTRNKRKTDLKYNLNQKITHAIYLSLKGNKAGRKWEGLVGYTLNNLMKSLKKTMPKNYAWQDYMEGKLHVDHTIPINAFNFSKAEHIDFKRCWALSNLRLLPAKENMCKNDKLIKPFQPCLEL